MIHTVATAALAAAFFAVQAPAQAPAATAAQAPAVTAAAGDEESGRDIYAGKCRSCHSGAIAPSLSGVVGRPIASVSGYAYSDALKGKGPAPWTPETLSAFLQNPQAYAPGTKMPVALPDDQQRADVIAYLKSLSASE